MPIEFDISVEITTPEARDFIQRRVSNDAPLYQRRRQASENKIREQITYGLAAEYIARKHERFIGLECPDPDLKIYKPSDKTWAPDLGAYRTVKACRTYLPSWGVIDKYVSWVMELQNGTLKGVSPGELLLAVRISEKTNTGFVYARFQVPSDIMRYLRHLNDPSENKLALYASDMPPGWLVV